MANTDHFALSARDSLELLFEVGREVASTLDLHTVLERVLNLSMKNVEAISGSILVLDEVGKPIDSAFLISGQARNRPEPQLMMTFEKGLAGWVARNRKAVLIENTAEDDRWLHRPDDAEEQTGAKSALGVPVMALDELVGVMTLVHPRRGFFSAEHLELARAIATQAGVAIRNTRLYERLQAAHQRYHELFEDSIDPILISDWNGNLIELNRQAAAILGIEQEKVGSTNIRDLISIEGGKIGLDLQNLSGGSTINYKLVLNTPTGRNIPVQVYAREIHNGPDSQLQWILRDITEIKDLNQIREDFTAMVYHDLRSPLANIVSSLEILVSMFPESVDESVHSLITIALRSTERIQRLTNSLLDINRLEDGHEIGTRHPTNIMSLAIEAVEVMSTNISNRELELIMDIPADLPFILADAEMIRRVFINLLENAIKFTPTKAKIGISAHEIGEFVEITVRDTGHGISIEDQKRVFDKFIRLTPQDGPRGLGLGLAYCRLTVLAHGGEIWVESQPGHGARFKFTLPVVKDLEKFRN